MEISRTLSWKHFSKRFPPKFLRDKSRNNLRETISLRWKINISSRCLKNNKFAPETTNCGTRKIREKRFSEAVSSDFLQTYIFKLEFPRLAKLSLPRHFMDWESFIEIFIASIFWRAFRNSEKTFAFQLVKKLISRSMALPRISLFRRGQLCGLRALQILFHIYIYCTYRLKCRKAHINFGKKHTKRELPNLTSVKAFQLFRSLKALSLVRSFDFKLKEHPTQWFLKGYKLLGTLCM
jgi:hypothetical protein